ncbi:MAG: NB-ARC domain-containing protein [Chloroflexota bacterium]
MPDAHRLFVLTCLREARGFTLEEMAQRCGLPGKRGRETVGRWERGQSIPRLVRRSPFIRYLCEDLGLRSDREQFFRIFAMLCEEWDWEPLTQSESQRLFADWKQPLAPGAERPPPPVRAIPLEARFSKPPDERLFGVEASTARVLAQLSAPGQRPVSIEGLGGIGKTTLAEHVIRQWLLRGDAPRGIVWVSARQEYLIERGIRLLPGGKTHLDLDDLFEQVLQKLGLPDGHLLALARKVSKTAEIVRGADCLIVLDNLESVQDFESLAPLLAQIPARFLITSRAHVPALAGMVSFSLDELSPADSLALIGYVAERKGLTAVPARRIYDLTGGNPLAIYLAVSLMRLTPPDRVLQDLRLGSVEAIYRYIYWKSWDALPEISRRLLFAIQRVGDTASWQWLHQTTGLSDADLGQALQILADLSLIKVETAGDERRFSIHCLTSTFLCTEVLGWK